jgi:hypothetical protein
MVFDNKKFQKRMKVEKSIREIKEGEKQEIRVENCN